MPDAPLPPPFPLGGRTYAPLALLGRGKSGYSYLVTSDGTDRFVLKQIHHEPCDYYTFGDKFAAERHAYQTLSALAIPLPRWLADDPAAERILKEYVPGPTALELAQNRLVTPDLLDQVRTRFCAILRPAGLNIDYYPANFVLPPDTRQLVYIDYEINPYDPRWDFDPWALPFWQPG